MDNVIKILLVDDEEELRDLLAFQLEQAGHFVKTASGGDMAFQYILENAIDVIVSDVKMPKGDGISLLQSINKLEGDRPPVIFTSGFGDSNRGKALELGAFDYQIKPITVSDLLESINRAVESKTESVV